MKPIKTHPSKTQYTYFSHCLREGLLITSLAMAIFFILSLTSFHASDPGWSHVGIVNHVANAGGKAGAWLADIFLYAFGYLAFLFPGILLYAAWLNFRHWQQHEDQFDSRFIALRSIGFVLSLLAGTSLLSLNITHPLWLPLPYLPGGIVGNSLSHNLTSLFNFTGTELVLLAVFLSGITLLTGLSWFNLLDKAGRYALRGLAMLSQSALALLRLFKRKPFGQAVEEEESEEEYLADEAEYELAEDKEGLAIKPQKRNQAKEKKPVRIEPKVSLSSSSVPEKKPRNRRSLLGKSKNNSQDDSQGEGDLPSLALLDMPEKSNVKGYSNTALEAMSREVEAKLLDFGVEVQVVAVHPGPVITRFEMQLAAGVKVSKISGLAKDLARSLSTVSVRIVDVIPGKSVVGLELPNEYREIVRLREVLESQQYSQARSPLSMALGKDIAGHPVIVDLAKMPHLLVAGTTGSGKSVGLNAMLLSILYKSTPSEVRMIMIDPKMLELSIYDGIPHLLAPVVTDMREAANALRWCVAEMERRYKLMATLGVRNLAGYNAKVKEAQENNKPLLHPFAMDNEGKPEELQTLPYIMVLVDEFADMMMVVGKKVEDLIARIAQKARAAGIHMILATQRPSVDVITGLIKANIPTRIAFQVSSKIDSRTILDQQGAEQLLGHGDMLYLAPGTGVPVRVHGAFVADQEVHNVVDDLKKRGEPEYLHEIVVGDEAGGDDDSEDNERSAEIDPLYDQAVQIVIQSRRASISHIQRRLKIGYNRAARLIEEMENAGIVSSMEGNGSREVLVSEIED